MLEFTTQSEFFLHKCSIGSWLHYQLQRNRERDRRGKKIYKEEFRKEKKGSVRERNGDRQNEGPSTISKDRENQRAYANLCISGNVVGLNNLRKT